MRFPLSDRQFYLSKRSRRQLPFPTTAKLRIAQISATANPFYSATVFASKAWNELGEFHPHVLIGSVSDIQRLSAHQKLLGLDSRNIDHAILVLTSWRDRPISDVTRVVLWQTFGVPVYELIVATPDVILAAECIAHQGWHLEPSITTSVRGSELFFETRGRRVASVEGELITQPCHCGRTGARMMKLIRHAKTRHLAAIA
jgi:hypothetical protein